MGWRPGGGTVSHCGVYFRDWRQINTGRWLLGCPGLGRYRLNSLRRTSRHGILSILCIGAVVQAANELTHEFLREFSPSVSVKLRSGISLVIVYLAWSRHGDPVFDPLPTQICGHVGGVPALEQRKDQRGEHAQVIHPGGAEHLR